MSRDHPSPSIEEVLRRLPRQTIPPLSIPPYTPLSSEANEQQWDQGSKVALAVSSMRDHMTDEGWQIMEGLEHAGYHLAGHGLSTFGALNYDLRRSDLTDVPEILRWTNPSVVVVQDKREWDKSGDFRDQRAYFHRISALAERDDIFKLTILKDAHQRPHYHRHSAEEMGAHGWIIYYHPRIVERVAPYVRLPHCVRTYHSINPQHLPPVARAELYHCVNPNDFPTNVPTFFSEKIAGTLLSGAVSGAYPLRKQLVKKAGQLPNVIVLPHPGYHRQGCATPRFLEILCRYKVAICTASLYGYALRKIIEATACGCVVLTDLPHEEVLPEIDGNLIRISPEMGLKGVAATIKKCYDDYDPVKQWEYAIKAQRWYDYRAVGMRLAQDIDKLRESYP